MEFVQVGVHIDYVVADWITAIFVARFKDVKVHWITAEKKAFAI